MEDVLSRALEHVKWEEDVANRAKAQLKQDQMASKQAKTNRDGGSPQRKEVGSRNRGRFPNRPLGRAEGMNVSTWPNISNLTISKPELSHVLRQMAPQVKWPQKMQAPDFFRNPNRWCDFHSDHGHKTEDCVSLRIKVNEPLKKGHLQEFLSDKAKNLLNKETNNKPPEIAPTTPPRHDIVIHVISSGSEISGISHVAAKKSN